VEIEIPIQFKYGKVWQLKYKVGDDLQWGANIIGKRGAKHVVVDGVAEKCPNCQHDDEWNVYIHIENDRLSYVENANGRFDFARSGSNYIVLEPD
jgi:hypothetical protein